MRGHMSRRYLLSICIVFFGTAVSFLFAKPIDAQGASALIATPVPPPSPTSSTTFKNGANISITGTAASGNFVNYQVEWAAGLDPGSGWQSTGITLAGGGLSSVSNGFLANWDTSSIAASGYYTVRLTLNSSNLAPQQVKELRRAGRVGHLDVALGGQGACLLVGHSFRQREAATENQAPAMAPIKTKP